MWDLTSVIISADKQVYISLAAILSLTAKAIDALQIWYLVLLMLSTELLLANMSNMSLTGSPNVYREAQSAAC